MSFTAADYERLPEGFPAELLEGMLVKEPAPLWRHQELVARLLFRLFRQVGPGRVVASPIDVFLDERNVLQPDLLVVAEEDRGTLQTTRAPLPVLVIEILSPSTAERDREEKTAVYLRAGVREVWLVDPDAETIETVTNAGRRLHAAEERVRSAAAPGFETSYADLKADDERPPEAC